MARCGCSNTCACTVTAGDGITVTGVGSVADPYVVGADGEAGNLAVVDTATLNLSVAGDGTPGDPWVLSGVVPAGSVTPATEATQDLVGAMAGDGLAYDDPGGTLDARLSTDAGNAVVFGTDGGLDVRPRLADYVASVDEVATVDVATAGLPAVSGTAVQTETGHLVLDNSDFDEEALFLLHYGAELGIYLVQPFVFTPGAGTCEFRAEYSINAGAAWAPLYSRRFETNGTSTNAEIVRPYPPRPIVVAGGATVTVDTRVVCVFTGAGKSYIARFVYKGVDLLAVGHTRHS